MDAIGPRLKRLREERRWTQAELADLVGVSAKSIGNWERGEHVPRNRIGALEKVFGVSMATGESMHGDDDVVRAIETSKLNRSDKAEMLSHYWRLLDAASEQDHV